MSDEERQGDQFEALLARDLEVLHGFKADLHQAWPETERFQVLGKIAADPEVARALIFDAIDAIKVVPTGMRTGTEDPAEFRAGLVALTGLTHQLTRDAGSRRAIAARHLQYKEGTLRVDSAVRGRHLAAIAHQMADLIPQAEKLAVLPRTDAAEERVETSAEMEPAEGSPAAEGAPSEEVSGAPPDPSRRRRRGAAGAMVAAALVIAAILAFVAPGFATKASAHNNAINAETGKPSKQPKAISLPFDTDVLGGGHFLYICDLTRRTAQSCPSGLSPATTITAHVGDVLQFQSYITLTSGKVPLPLFRIYMQIDPYASRVTTAVIELNYPVQPPPKGCRGACSSQGEDLSTAMKIKFAGARASLRYITGSTELLNQADPPKKIARLPDGITQLPGLLMTELGAPRGCFDCLNDDDRIITFEARVVR